MLSQFKSYTDFSEIWHGDTLLCEEEHRLLFTPITDVHTGGAIGKSL